MCVKFPYLFTSNSVSEEPEQDDTENVETAEYDDFNNLKAPQWKAARSAD